MNATSTRLIGAVAIIYIMTSSCGNTVPVTQSSATTDEQDTSNSEFALDGGGADPSIWPVGRQAPYTVEIKCDNWSTTINGANSTPQSIVIPKDARNCVGYLTKLTLANRKYSLIDAKTAEKFAIGSTVELTEAKNPKDIVGVYIQQQILANSKDPRTMEFKFTGITERRRLDNTSQLRGMFGNGEGVRSQALVDSFLKGVTLRSIITSSNGSVTTGKFILDTDTPQENGCMFLKTALGSMFFHDYARLRFSTEIAPLASLSLNALEKIFKSTPTKLVVEKCSASQWFFSANFPSAERMILAWATDNLLTVKTTSIIIPYSYESESTTCEPKTMVVDENAAESFNNRQAIVDVINTACKSNPLSSNYHIAGAAFNHPFTANAICRFRGFKSGIILKSGKYLSPHDNFIGKWEGPDVSTVADITKISGKIQRYGATANNNTIDQLTCKGKLNAACLPKAQEIRCE